MEDKELFVQHNQIHGWWWFGNGARTSAAMVFNYFTGFFWPQHLEVNLLFCVPEIFQIIGLVHYCLVIRCSQLALEAIYIILFILACDITGLVCTPNHHFGASRNHYQTYQHTFIRYKYSMILSFPSVQSFIALIAIIFWSHDHFPKPVVFGILWPCFNDIWSVLCFDFCCCAMPVYIWVKRGGILLVILH